MNKIVKFTERYNVTDHEAALILGVSPGNLSEWKNGKRLIPHYVSHSIDLHMDISQAHINRIKEQRLCQQ